MHHEVTFTAASSDATNYSVLPVVLGEAPTGRSDGGHQVLRFSADANNAGGSAVLQLVEVDTLNSEVVWREDITLSHPATARRTGLANSSGNYVLSAVADASGNHYVDIGGVPANRNRQLRLGCRALTTITSLRVRVQASRNA